MDKTLDANLSEAFPRLKEILGDLRWHRLLRDFDDSDVRYVSAEPNVLDAAEAFLNYLQYAHEPSSRDPAFMLALAQYEWAILAVTVSDKRDSTDAHIDANGDLLTGSVVLSPEVLILTFYYPVHRITVENQPSEAVEEPYCFVAYRHNDGEVEMLEVDSFISYLLHTIESNPLASGGEVLEHVAKQTSEDPEGDLKPLIEAGLEAMEALRKKGVILGTTTSVIV